MRARGDQGREARARPQEVREGAEPGWWGHAGWPAGQGTEPCVWVRWSRQEGGCRGPEAGAVSGGQVEVGGTGAPVFLQVPVTSD